MAYNLEIEYVDIKYIVPYAKNSRIHSEEQINQICASINEFGFCNPILIDDANMIIAGHGRVLAAERIGLESIPAVRLTGLTNMQKKAYLVADNSIALNASWDISMLSQEVDDLIDSEFDVDLLSLPDDIFGSDGADIELEFDSDGETGLRMPKMKFGNTTIEISHEELESLNTAYKQYTESTGSSYGFVTGVLLNE